MPARCNYRIGKVIQQLICVAPPDPALGKGGGWKYRMGHSPMSKYMLSPGHGLRDMSIMTHSPGSGVRARGQALEVASGEHTYPTHEHTCIHQSSDGTRAACCRKSL